VVVDDNRMTLYQITEPLLATSSATPANPAPFGTDIDGTPLNDPIPDTLVDPATGAVVTPPADGASTLLDRFTIVKPDVDDRVRVHLSRSDTDSDDGRTTYIVTIDNGSAYPLNGSQLVLRLPEGAGLADATSDTRTVVDDTVVVTLGRIDAGQVRQITLHVVRNGSQGARGEDRGEDDQDAVAFLRSSTAQTVVSNRIGGERDRR
jgi:hypothetical protein